MAVDTFSTECPMPDQSTPVPSHAAAAIPPNPLRALYPLAARPGMVSLAGGHPSADAYDRDGLAEAAAIAAADPALLRYGPSVGLPALREALAARSDCPPEAVVVTSGSQQGIDLALRAVANPGDAVAVPTEIYPAVLGLLAANGVRAVAVAGDADGPTPDALGRVLAEASPRALYLTPCFGNPTGRVIPLERRAAILSACAAAGCAVIEDDPYRALALDAEPLPPMHAEPHGATVIGLHSLSKTLAPGLRIGWTVVPPSLRDAVAALKQATDLQSSGPAQGIALAYLRSGREEDWLARVRDLYRARRDALLEALGGAVEADAPSGGMFVWARLREERDPGRVFDAAVARGVLYAPGTAFAVDPERHPTARRLRLCFATADEGAMRRAAARLSEALERE